MFCVLELFFQETITSASSITQSLTSELLDGHRKLLALVASGNAKAHNNGPITGPPEVLNAETFPASIAHNAPDLDLFFKISGDLSNTFHVVFSSLLTCLLGMRTLLLFSPSQL